ncbi:MAG: PDZ domain-containing protein [Pseudomonadota bacterium]
MLVRILTLCFALIAGVVIGARVAGTTPASDDYRPATGRTAAAAGIATVDPVSAGDHAEAIRSLNDIVAQEVSERLRLQQEMEDLREQLDAMEKRLASATSVRQAATPANARGRGQQVVLTEERLIEAGFSAFDAAELKAKVDQIEMDRLYLQDTARREGWTGKERYREEMLAINQRSSAFREELGDDGYDKYLFALGRPNRVVVQSVLDQSPAEVAGIRPGDYIMSYDGSRLFRQGEIRQLTATGQAGATVPVDIVRDGRVMQVYIPRGPLGIRMSSATVQPDS